MKGPKQGQGRERQRQTKTDEADRESWATEQRETDGQRQIKQTDRKRWRLSTEKVTDQTDTETARGGDRAKRETDKDISDNEETEQRGRQTKTYQTMRQSWRLRTEKKETDQTDIETQRVGDRTKRTRQTKTD